ncbi:MAG: proton-conducting membrane transporter [Acidimicrobiaceae bacterium]|nr:proton-conducting membrane transporter [Acidimicrobiaceae bacterium]
MISSDSLPRLLHGSSGRPLTLAQHEETFAISQRREGTILDHLEASGLTGRGGAAFPTARKVRLIHDQRGHNKFVVVNAMEGEPASHKDRTLLGANPHLVLDGAEYLAAMVGANNIAVAVARDNPIVVNHLERAIHERSRRSLRGPKIELHTPPWRYVAGEESALVNWLDDNQSLPQYRPRRPTILRIGHGPVLVDNAETCANVGLIGRFGAEWWRGLGTRESPGTVLVSITGAVTRPTVLEASLGSSLRSILATGGADPNPQALLMGGYGGAWISGDRLDIAYSNQSLQEIGATVGAGIIIVLPRDGCGLVETQRIAHWMANESARQCGPCAFGLPALAEDLSQLTHNSREPQAVFKRIVERCGVIENRGACRHPDGVIRLIRSALDVFSEDIANHMRGAPCSASRSNAHFATVPALEREEELIWE